MKFFTQLADIFNHRPTQTESDYSKMSELLSDAQSWADRDFEVEKSNLELLVSNINRRIIKLSENV